VFIVDEFITIYLRGHLLLSVAGTRASIMICSY